MVSYSNPELLEDHGNRFVCILFFLARGVRDRRFDVDKVYGKLEMKGFDDQQQARAELIQDLEQQRLQRIEYDWSTNMVRLTDEGVQWARKECDKLPYLAYRIFKIVLKHLFIYITLNKHIIIGLIAAMVY